MSLKGTCVHLGKSGFADFHFSSSATLWKNKFFFCQILLCGKVTSTKKAILFLQAFCGNGVTQMSPDVHGNCFFLYVEKRFWSLIGNDHPWHCRKIVIFVSFHRGNGASPNCRKTMSVEMRFILRFFCHVYVNCFCKNVAKKKLLFCARRFSIVWCDTVFVRKNDKSKHFFTMPWKIISYRW